MISSCWRRSALRSHPVGGDVHLLQTDLLLQVRRQWKQQEIARLTLNLTKTPTTVRGGQTHQHRFLTTSDSTHAQLTNPTTTRTPTSQVNPFQLLRVCTILYQQQNSPESRLHSNLSSINFHLTHEFFFQVYNNFPLSWHHVHLFFLYTQKSHPQFPHNTLTFNKMLDIRGKS